MLHREYRRQRRALLKINPAKPDIVRNKLLYTQFVLVSAGLKNYLPEIPYNQHEQLFQQMLLHQQLSILEQHYNDLDHCIVYENLTGEHLKLLKNGAIISTFHTGSYRAVNVFLIKQKIPFVLIVNDKMFKEQYSQLIEIFTKQNNNKYDPKEFSIINAEAPGGLMQMLRELRNGRTLVIYADGNTGSGSNNAANKNCHSLPFLGKHIYARTGIAFLALATGRPILPVLSYRKTINDIRLKFFDPLHTGSTVKGADKKILSTRITHHLFDLLASIVQLYPEQWESWFYLHNMANIVFPNVRKYEESPNRMSRKGELRFNEEDFGIFNAGDNHYLFNKAQYTAYPIDRALYKKLYTARLGIVKKKEFNHHIMSELLENKVFLLKR
ncbi:MAG: LpxL/LpxP family acyltransferase [Agriterribacter sp.]